jgi:hypothetical protein
MAELNPDQWPQLHMRLLALSRWDNEGGASPSRRTAGSADQSARRANRLARAVAARQGAAIVMSGHELPDASTKRNP